MADTLLQSPWPMVADTLPAFKVRHYTGSLPGGDVYTYARMYLHGDTLVAGLWAFERDPSPQSLILLGISGPKASLLTSLSPAAATIGFVPENAATPGEAAPALQPLASLSIERATGSDEQGWYWGAQLRLPPEVLALAGITAPVSGSLRMALFKASEGESAWGASFEGPHPLVASRWNELPVSTLF